MRILHVIGTVDPAAGGPSEVVRVLVEFRPPGTEAEVVTLDDPHADFLKDARFPVHALGPVASTYGRTPKLLRWLQANRDRFDGVVVHGLWQYCTRAVHKAMRGRVPYMVFPHGMLDPYFKRQFPLKHSKKWIYWLAVEYWVLRDAARVLFTTAAEQELAKRSFWVHSWKGQTVPFGTVPPDGDPAQQLAAFYAACPQAPGKRLLLFLGRIHAKKGCDMLVDAFVRAAAQNPELELVMAGPDQQNSCAWLQQRAQAAGVEARVHWPGMLLGDAKWGAFRASEAFILPSHQENFGIAVAEALACGRPVLLSDKVNIAADIAADGAGLMEPDTPAGTVRLLERWMRMPAGERAAMGQRALECFDRRYDMRDGAKAVVELFEQLRPVSRYGV
jgi:glycosyltransferase involved in cell wall biosynthesis